MELNGFNKKNIAFAMMRMQTIHKGHFRLIAKMLEENDIVIIGLGSAQISGTFDNPFTIAERIEMLKLLFGQGAIGKHGKIKIVPIEDLGAAKPIDWVNHCFDKIIANGLELPNRYYAGSVADSMWYKDYETKTYETNNLNVCGGNYNPYNETNKTLKHNTTLEIKVLDRHTISVNMSGTEIRKDISNGFYNWKSEVPECLHSYILEKFPKKFLLNEILKNK